MASEDSFSLKTKLLSPGETDPRLLLLPLEPLLPSHSPLDLHSLASLSLQAGNLNLVIRDSLWAQVSALGVTQNGNSRVASCQPHYSMEVMDGERRPLQSCEENGNQGTAQLDPALWLLTTENLDTVWGATVPPGSCDFRKRNFSTTMTSWYHIFSQRIVIKV